MGRVATRSHMTADDYLAWERAQLDEHEFFHGEVFAMVGGSPRHDQICVNVSTALNVALRPRGCRVLPSDQRISFMNRTRYVYPDVSVVCGPLELEANDVLLNPQVLVEVLSSSTEQYDRGLEWESYQRLGSLTDYVLVSQTEPRIEHFQRAADGSWTYRATEAGGRVVLANGAVLVDEIFDGVFELKGD